MKGSFDDYLDAAARGKTAAELADEPASVLKGISEGGSDKLEQVLGAETVGEFARNRFVERARAIAARASPLDHDPGPNLDWTAFFGTAPLATYQAHPSEFRLDFGPIYYRGRLDGTARLLVIGQDPAANELIAHRAFVGTSGQRLQGFLRRVGLAHDYVIVNAYLYPVFGQVFGTLEDLLSDTDILGFRNAYLDRLLDENSIEAVLCVGRAARLAMDLWPVGQGLNRTNITHPAAQDHAALLANWNDGLSALKQVVAHELGAADDTATYGTDWADADLELIPRADLPFGIPEWHGVGSRAVRARTESGETDHKRIIWHAP